MSSEIEKLDKQLRNETDGTLRSYVRHDYPASWQPGTPHHLQSPFEQLTTNEKRAVRASNELARRSREAAKAATQQQQEQEQRKAVEAQFTAQLEKHMSERRKLFAGNDAQWNAIKGDIEREYLLDAAKAKSSLESNREFLERSSRYHTL